MWITVPQAALLAQRSQETIRRWVRQDRIAHRGHGAGYLVPARDVLELEAHMYKRGVRTQSQPEPDMFW